MLIRNAIVMQSHLLFLLLQIVANVLTEGGPNIFPNSIVGVPEITCNEDRLSLMLKTSGDAPSHIFAKGHFTDQNCKISGSNSANFSLSACGMNRQRQLEPKGLAYALVVIVQLHPRFITKVDRAYSVRCFYTESEKTVTSSLDVSQLATDVITAGHALPACTYSLHVDSPNGPQVKYARIGDRVYHNWECPSDVYGMLVHSCFVDDGQGNKIRILDERGCGVDQFILKTPDYSTDLTRAQQETQVYKFADRVSVYFNCQIKLCIRGEACGTVTPPHCPESGSVVPSENLVLNQTIVPPAPSSVFPESISPSPSPAVHIPLSSTVPIPSLPTLLTTGHSVTSSGPAETLTTISGPVSVLSSSLAATIGQLISWPPPNATAQPPIAANNATTTPPPLLPAAATYAVPTSTAAAETLPSFATRNASVSGIVSSVPLPTPSSTIVQAGTTTAPFQHNITSAIPLSTAHDANATTHGGIPGPAILPSTPQQAANVSIGTTAATPIGDRGLVPMPGHLDPNVNTSQRPLEQIPLRGINDTRPTIAFVSDEQRQNISKEQLPPNTTAAPGHTTVHVPTTEQQILAHEKHNMSEPLGYERDQAAAGDGSSEKVQGNSTHTRGESRQLPDFEHTGSVPKDTKLGNLSEPLTLRELDDADLTEEADTVSNYTLEESAETNSLFGSLHNDIPLRSEVEEELLVPQVHSSRTHKRRPNNKARTAVEHHGLEAQEATHSSQNQSENVVGSSNTQPQLKLPHESRLLSLKPSTFPTPGSFEAVSPTSSSQLTILPQSTTPDFASAPTIHSSYHSTAFSQKPQPTPQVAAHLLRGFPEERLLRDDGSILIFDGRRIHRNVEPMSTRHDDPQFKLQPKQFDDENENLILDVNQELTVLEPDNDGYFADRKHNEIAYVSPSSFPKSFAVNEASDENAAIPDRANHVCLSSTGFSLIVSAFLLLIVICLAVGVWFCCVGGYKQTTDSLETRSHQVQRHRMNSSSCSSSAEACAWK